MSRAAQATIERAPVGLPRRPAGRELRAALDTLLSSAGRIAGIDTRPMPYASSFAIEEVDVRFDDGRTVGLVCKDSGNRAVLPEARGVKPGFLRNPQREIAVYESILAPVAVSAPRYYGQLIDRSRGRYWLFLERVAGPPLAEVGDFAVWRQVSGFLARLHTDARLSARSAALIDSIPLVRYDAALFRRWMWRARHFQITSQDSPARRRRLQWLASKYDAIVDEIEALPTGFVHGEFYASNVLVECASREMRVRPLDWELAGVGSPLIDLAALTAGWTTERREDLARSYYQATSPRDRCWMAFGAFMRALDCCRVQLAVRCLGWARRWTPPNPHTQDWLGEALQAVERLGS